MSLGYADRLKQKRNLGGQLGAQEFHEDFNAIKEKAETLAAWVSDAKRVFIFTGAGISTSCGIPDFRGPNGIWTLRKKKLPVPTDFVPFEFAKPTFTHQAIAALVVSGKAPYVCSQNVDSLHIRSGVPRSQVAELHGNCFAERCATCRTEYQRDFQMDKVGFKPTGRRCTRPGCGGELRDNILDWDSPLPDDELEAAVEQAEDADVALVLGTSLQITPANEIPTLTRDQGGKMVIVNLQKTPKDRRANLIVRAKVDVVMALLVQRLNIQVPPYIRTEQLHVAHAIEPTTTSSADGPYSLQLTVSSLHGPSCPLPIVQSMTLTCQAAQGSCSSSAAGAAASWEPSCSGQLTSDAAYAFRFNNIPAAVRSLRCTLDVQLVKWADADKQRATLHYDIELPALGAAQGPGTSGPRGGVGGAQNGAQVLSFVSQEAQYAPHDVVASFLAAPPQVVLPKQRPRKKAKASPEPDPSSSDVDGAGSEPAGNLRRSQRTPKTKTVAKRKKK